MLVVIAGLHLDRGPALGLGEGEADGLTGVEADWQLLFTLVPLVATCSVGLGDDAKAVLGRTTSPAITTIEALTSVIVARLSFIMLLLVWICRFSVQRSNGNGLPGVGTVRRTTDLELPHTRVRVEQQPPPSTGPTLSQLPRPAGVLPPARIGLMQDRLVQAIVLVPDLRDGRRRLEALGFAVLDGGRHPGRGTANLIVPFGRQYLELLAVVDEPEARSSPQGRPVVAALSARGPGLARWSVEPVDLEATAARVGDPVERRERTGPTPRPSGGVRWPWTAPGPSPGAAPSWPGTVPTCTRATVPSSTRTERPVSPGSTWWCRTWGRPWRGCGGRVPSGVVVEPGDHPGVRSLRISSPSGEILVG